MAILERDVLLQGKTKEGDMTMDFPITRLANIEDSANEKENLADEDYIPVMDSGDKGQMKKFPFSTLKTILGKIFAASNHTHSNYAASSHNHDSSYAAKTHSHDYAATNHNHDTSYAAKTHSHDYAATNHTHSNYAASSHNHDSSYAAKTHSHDYAATNHTHSNYAASSHNHDTSYAAKTHSHDYAATNHTHSNYAASSHNHDSSYAAKTHSHDYAPKANPTFTGTAKATANTNYTTQQIRNIAFGTSKPTSLENGAIYMVYE